jgi:hypothetical protein
VAVLVAGRSCFWFFLSPDSSRQNKPVRISRLSRNAFWVAAFLASGRLEGALKELPKAAQIRPASPEVHCNLATVYGKRNRPGDAQRERQRFAELHAEMAKQRGSPAPGAARRRTLSRSPSY